MYQANTHYKDGTEVAVGLETREEKGGIALRLSEALDYSKVEYIEILFEDMSCMAGEDGYILIFNNKPEFEEFYEQGSFRFHVTFGWYLPSSETVPVLPEGCVPKVLSWETVGGEDGELIAEDKLIKAFNKFVRSI